MLAFKYPNPLNLSVKGAKSWNTPDGGGYQFTLCRGGKSVAEVTEEGHGGMLWVRWIKGDEDTEKSLHELCKTIPPVDIEGIVLVVDTDLYLAELFENFEINRKLERARKKATPFRLVDDNEEAGFRTVNTPDVVQAEIFLKKKFGEGRYVIL